VAVRLSGGDYYQITYFDGTRFVINRTATEVWVTWPPTLTVRDVPSYLLGPVIGRILRLRGITCLHASAIDVGGRAVLFVGPKGAGKSTLAAAFAIRRVPVLADDTVSLRESDLGWSAVPGYPRLRLWPESAHSLVQSAGEAGFLPPGESGSARRYHLDLMAPRFGFRPEPRPLGAVYLLQRGNATDDNMPSVAGVRPAEGVVSLVDHSFGKDLLDRELRGREFEVLSRVVTQVPIRRLTRSTDLTHLPEFCEFVLDDLRSLGLAQPLAATI
jgi:hypothetical protein